MTFSCFNPRTHTGCDFTLSTDAEIEQMFQSTHPHGMRQQAFTERATDTSFNPRTHTGCDRLLLRVYLRVYGFNPRTHTGCDYPHVDLYAYNISFNPRTHTGCDKVVAKLKQTTTVSIHAPTRDATKLRY